jgi:AraC-like DNA-binding protein
MKQVFEGYSLKDAEEISKASLYFEKLQDSKNIANMDKYSQDLGTYQTEVNKLFKTMNALNFNNFEELAQLEDSDDEMEIEYTDEKQQKAFEKKIQKAADKLGKKD